MHRSSCQNKIKLCTAPSFAAAFPFTSSPPTPNVPFAVAFYFSPFRSERAPALSVQEEENAAELKIPQEFLQSKCLTNSEVAIILEHRSEQLLQLVSDGGEAAQVSQVFEKSLEYVKRFGRHRSADAVRQVRETLCRYRLLEFELCVLGNLCPEGVNEAKALVPSLAARFDGDERIEKMVGDLSLIKKFE